MSVRRLQELHDYAEAMALKAWYSGRGCAKDLEEIANALAELIELKQEKAFEELKKRAA